MTQIGWAILGTGIIARKFAAALRLAKDARLVSVMSRDSATASAFATASGATRGVSQLDDVLADDNVDIVYIATPNHLHAAQAIACLKAGKAVLCEKPLATSASDARAIAAAAANSGRFCMEALWTLCLPALDLVQKLVAEGRIGTVREISGSLSFAREFDPQSRFFNPELGGGALLDLGVYPLSLAVSIMGKPQAVRSIIRPAPNGVDLQASLVMQHEHGLAQIACGFHAEGANDMVICGTSGIIRLQAPLNAPALVSLTSRPPRSVSNDIKLASSVIAPDKNSRLGAVKQMLRPLKPGRTRLFPAPYRGNGFIHQMEEAMACLREGRLESRKVPLQLSIAVQEVIDEAKRQIKQT